MRSLVLVLVIVCGARSAGATPQVSHQVIFGQRTYVLHEIPMLGLWDYGTGSAGTGKRTPPRFDLISTANGAGYQAEFEIRDSKFWLRKMTGQIAGKQKENEQIIAGERFPIVASWFTGRLHLEVGEFDDDAQEATAVLIFHVEKGVLTRTVFADRMKLPGTWNGLPPGVIEHQTTVPIAGIGTVQLPPGKWLLERVSNHQTHDIYMFEKTGARLERLSFQMFKGDSANSLNKQIDAIGGGVVGVVGGIPRGVLKMAEEGSATSQLVRPVVNLNEHCLTASYIITTDNSEPWINHALVGHWNNAVLVCVHASPHVLSPDSVKDVYVKLNELSSK